MTYAYPPMSPDMVAWLRGTPSTDPVARLASAVTDLLALIPEWTGPPADSPQLRLGRAAVQWVSELEPHLPPEVRARLAVPAPAPAPAPQTTLPAMPLVTDGQVSIR